jgi:tubby-related protein 1
VIPQAPLTLEQKELHNAFIEKLTSEWTQPEELREMFSKPLPPRIGQVRTTISRVKSGLSMLWPKYTLNLSDSNKFLLAGKKKSGSATSKYVISSNSNQMEKNSGGYLGKVRSNFLGTEFTIFDNGKGPKKAEQQKNNLRTQQGVVQYETNVLGSKGPRRMKVLLPNVDLQGQQHSWRPLDNEHTIQEQFKINNTENIMFFFNKPPKWNEQVQAFVLNFNGRVDKASVKNFQLIDEYDDNHIYMQFGRVGKDSFNMDVAFPCSLFQAFAIGLTSFDFKFACE